MRRSVVRWIATVAVGLACAGCNGPRAGTPGLEPPGVRMPGADAGAQPTNIGSAGGSSIATGGKAGRGGSFGNPTASGTGGAPQANQGGMSGASTPSVDGGLLMDQDAGALEP